MMDAPNKFQARIAAALLALALLSACAVAPSRDAPGQRHYVGIVVKASGGQSYNTTSDSQRNMMGGMYGAFGLVMSDILGSRRTSPSYRVKVSEELEVVIPSNEKFSEGDCVAVWIPESAGARHYFGDGEAGIEKSSACK